MFFSGEGQATWGLFNWYN